MPPKKVDVKSTQPRPKKTVKKNGVMTVPVPAGTVVKDINKESWVVGPAIGQGGFGVIYSARSVKDASKDFARIIKFEPHGSGPLFVERSFYMKVAKDEHLKTWVQTHKLPYLGLPRYWGSGSHMLKNENYRFLVTDRFSADLWTKFLASNRKFPLSTVLRIAMQTIDALEYMHSNSYVHMDIKATNLMLGLEKSDHNRIFVIDFGLVSRPNTNPVYKKDPKQAHNGTIEYLSRDAHDGVPSMRGDLEVLGFNMLHWLSSSLPWENIALSTTKGKETMVQQLKIKFMADLNNSIKNMELDATSAGIMKEYLSYVSSVKHNEAPNYAKIQGVLKTALRKIGASDKGPFIFTTASGSSTSKATTPRKTTVVKEHIEKDDDEVNQEKKPKKTIAKKRGSKVDGSKKSATAREAKAGTSQDSEDETDIPVRKIKRRGKAEATNFIESSEEDDLEVCEARKATPRSTRAEARYHKSSDEEKQDKKTSKRSRAPVNYNYDSEESFEEVNVPRRAKITALKNDGSSCEETQESKFETPKHRQAERFKALERTKIDSPVQSTGSPNLWGTPEITDDDTPNGPVKPRYSHFPYVKPLQVDANTSREMPGSSGTPTTARSLWASPAKPDDSTAKDNPRDGALASSDLDSSTEEDFIESTPSPPKRQKRLGRSALAKLAAGEAANKGSEGLPKWKQCDSAQASNVERAGEYSRQNSNAKDKPNKQGRKRK